MPPGSPRWTRQRRQSQQTRLLLVRWQKLAAARKSFAVESTPSGRIYVHRLLDAREAGYRVSVVYLWLLNADYSRRRVRQRVRRGGHDLPTADIRRRYLPSMRHFFAVYLPLADEALQFGATSTPPKLVAEWDGPQNCTIHLPEVYERIREQIAS